jgi:hypothetical protein
MASHTLCVVVGSAGHKLGLPPWILGTEAVMLSLDYKFSGEVLALLWLPCELNNLILLGHVCMTCKIKN